jgi:hypothetical protein
MELRGEKDLKGSEEVRGEVWFTYQGLVRRGGVPRSEKFFYGAEIFLIFSVPKEKKLFFQKGTPLHIFSNIKSNKHEEITRSCTP